MDRKCPWLNLGVSQCNHPPRVDQEHGLVEMMVVLNAMVVIMAIVAAMVVVEEARMIEVLVVTEVEIQIITDEPMPILDGVVLLLVEVRWEVVERRLTHAMVEVVVEVVIDMVAEVAIHLVLETVIVIVVVVLTHLVGEEEEHPLQETRLAPPPPRLLHLLREKDHV